MTDGSNDRAFFRFTGNERGLLTFAISEQRGAILKRDVAIVQFVIVAAEAAPGQDRRDLLIKESRFLARRLPAESDSGSGDETDAAQVHLNFCPTPN